jgi:hypothetical protein
MFNAMKPITELPSLSRHSTRSGMKTEQGAGKLVDASTGDINAYDKKDLAAKIAALGQAISGGAVDLADSVWAPQSGKLDNKKVELYNEMRAAFNAPGSSDVFKVMGEVFSDDLWETMNREGFSTQVLARKDIPDGVDARIPIRRKDVVAFQAMNDAETIAQVIEQPYVYPNDYYLNCMITVEERELAQRGPELLDEKFQDGLEATMVRQDRICRSLFEATRGSFNAPVAYTNFMPQVFSNLRTQVGSNGISVVHAILAFDVWDDIIADPTFTSWWDPVHKYQLILEGKLGSILNVKLITDGFRYQNLRVLNPGEFYMLGTPVALGMRTVRREVQATEINQYNLGAPRRGWFFSGVEAMHLMDRAVAIGNRV